MTNETWKEKWSKHISELEQLTFCENLDEEGNTPIVFFGAKTIRDNEVFTIPDWGHVLKFIENEVIPEIRREDESKAKELLRNLRQYVHHSNGVRTTTLAYIPPSTVLRNAADEMERKDALLAEIDRFLSNT